MKMRIEDLGEPALEFGQRVLSQDPKRGLSDAGPFASTYIAGTKQIQLGLVALPSEIDHVRRWIERMHKLLLDDESNALRFSVFPGLEKTFRCQLHLPDNFIRQLDEKQYEISVSRPPHQRFESLLKLYGGAIKSLFTDQHPDCILVCFPEEVATLRISNPKLSERERLALERLQQEEEAEQLSLFEPTEEDKRLAAELLPQADELLFRNFHRALKANCMMAPNPVPIQVIRRHTYISAEAKQSDATRAWNLALALYYKAGNIPWRPHNLPVGTCFIGVSFHHLKRQSGDLVYASVAQAFSASVEPFALKGESIPRDQLRNKRPYLTESQASNLMHKIISGYQDRTGSVPSRVIVHKTSHYQPEEQVGFRGGLLNEVAACELVWMRPTGLRLLRRGMQPPARGTLFTIEDRDHYLFTTGFVNRWDEYPGPHIPAPLEIGVCGESNIIDRAQEILCLTKMNWNSAEGIGRHPITLSFARRVGTIMTEMDEDISPNPLYRFYM
jgi:hypothetical protein